MMKQIIYYIALVFAFTHTNAQLNNLSKNELLDGIRFNDVSLGTIMETKGDIKKIRALFGSNMQELSNNTGIYIGKELYDNNMVLSFEDETGTGNDYNLTTIYVLNYFAVVKVKGLSIKKGDDKSKFKDFLFNAKDSSYNFTDRDTGSVGLSFKISKYGKVSAIELICF